MSEAFTIQLTGLDGVLELLKSLPAEIVSKRGGPVKTALRKGALVLLAAEKANLQSVIASDRDKATRESTGTLLKSLVVTRGKAPTDGKGERYLVRVKKRAYALKGKTVTTLQTAQLLEYGTSRQTAKPFIRSAFASKAVQAAHTIETELVSEIDKVVAKLSK